MTDGGAGDAARSEDHVPEIEVDVRLAEGREGVAQGRGLQSAEMGEGEEEEEEEEEGRDLDPSPSASVPCDAQR